MPDLVNLLGLILAVPPALAAALALRDGRAPGRGVGGRAEPSA